MKRLVCFMLALIIALSFVACKSEDIILISSSHANAEVQNESSSNSEPISSNASINNHTHQYVKTQKTANCGESGGILYSCSCGDSYMENAIFPSYEHDFVEENISIGNTTRNIFRCTQCNVEALYVEEWWNLKTKFKEIRYYISGKLTAFDDGAGYIESDYEIVVCGVGDIEDYNEKKGNPPWREFLGTKLKSITVANGITSIGKNAFCYRTAKKQDASFYIGGSVKTIKSGAISLIAFL